jgi:hypothetical protein
MKQTHVEWLSSASAAARLDMTEKQFKDFRYRHPEAVKAYHVGRRLRFRAVDIDRAVEPMPEAQPAGKRLRLVSR